MYVLYALVAMAVAILFVRDLVCRVTDRLVIKRRLREILRQSETAN